METETTFAPPRRTGLAFQAGIALLLAALAGFLLYYTFRGQTGVTFLLYLLGALACLAPLVFLVYRIYSLLTSYYLFERDGLHLRWGLRFEDIPMNEIEWVRPAEEVRRLMTHPLPQAWLRWPGAVVGTRHDANFGEVEYMASQGENLVIVATRQKAYVISPSDPAAFIGTFDRLNELGSLSPLAPLSVKPTFLAGRAWQSRPARLLILASLGLGLVLLVWVVLVIPTRPEISLGFARGGLPEKAGPIERLLLLPVLAWLSILGSIGLGLYLYRRPSQRPVAYLLWAGCLLEALLLLAAMAGLAGS